MASASPQSNNVDTFLEDLSELSQKRLREDLQRQRDLQKNIDELRLRLNSSSPVKSGSYRSSLGETNNSSKYKEIPLLSFNRNEKPRFLTYDLIEENEIAPPMPKRPVIDNEISVSRFNRNALDEGIAPKMPKRPTSVPDNTAKPNKFESEEQAPPLPRRSKVDSYEINSSREKNVISPIVPSKSQNLLNRNTSNYINSVTNKNSLLNSIENTNSTGKYKSFMDIEKEIKSGIVPDFKSQRELLSINAKSVGPSIKPKPKELAARGSSDYNDSTPKTPTKSTDWIDSLANSKSRFNTTSPMIPKPSYANALFAAQNAKVASPPKPKDQSHAISKLGTNSFLKENTLHESTPIQPNIEKQKPILPDKSNINNIIPKSTSAKKLPPRPAKPSKDLVKESLNDVSLVKNDVSLVKKDADILKSTISNLNLVGKAKPSLPSKPRLSKYEELDSKELNSQLRKLGSTKSPIIERSETLGMAEGLAALNKLRPVAKPKVMEKPPKPEAIQSLEKIKATKPVLSKPPTKPNLNNTDKGTQTNTSKEEIPTKLSSEPKSIRPAFHDELASLIKPGPKTLPGSGGSITAEQKVSPKEASTGQSVKTRENMSNQKLSHPNKNRSKGPKRRLPKTMKTSLSDSNLSANLKSNYNQKEQENEAIKLQSAPNSGTKSKKPPPINKLSKPRTLPELKPSRNFSGDIFI